MADISSLPSSKRLRIADPNNGIINPTNNQRKRKLANDDELALSLKITHILNASIVCKTPTDASASMISPSSSLSVLAKAAFLLGEPGA